jgi:hypothetical protein
LSVFYINGFEVGDSSEVTTIPSGWSITSSSGIAGNYAAHNDGTGTSFLDMAIASSARVVASIRFRIPTNPGSSGGTDFHLWDTGNANMIAGVIFFGGANDNSWQVFLNSGSGGAGSTNIASINPFTLTSNVWHYLEFDISQGTSKTYNVWLDGVNIFSGTANFTAGTDIGVLRVGRTFISSSTNALDIDDITLDTNTQIGDARVIARQFISGTLVVDQWTKTGGSGTPETVLNDTPFNAATNINTNSYTNNTVAQDAFIASFSSTQTGHGTGVVAGADSIKGIQLSGIAKTSSTAAAPGVSLIGTPQSGSSTAGADVTLSLTVGASAAAGDVVVVMGGGIFRTGINYGPSGYTQIGTTQTSGSSGTGIAFGVWYKTMGATPDTTVVCRGTGTAGDGIAYNSRIFRGLLRDSGGGQDILDPTVVFSTPVTAGNPDPPSITPGTTGDVVVIGAASLVSDTNIGGATNYVSQTTPNAAATRPISSSMLHRITGITGGVAENPPAIGSVGNAWSSGLNIAATVSLKPTPDAGSTFYPRYIQNATTDTGLAGVVLTTSDALYRSSVFTDTLSNLNASYLRFYHGFHIALTTVEDAWVMVSYVPSPSQNYTLAATFVGAGALTGAIAKDKAISTTFLGAGALTANLAKDKAVAASYVGAGSLTATLRQNMITLASYAGAGLLSSTLQQGLAIVANYAGSGVLTGNPTKDKDLAATFAGSGLLTADVLRVLLMQASFGGAGGLTAALVQRMSVSATFAGAGLLTADIAKDKSLSATFAGSGLLAANLNLGIALQATYAGSGVMTADLAKSKDVAASFAGSGLLTASLRQGMLIGASFAGSGTMTTDVLRTLLVGATFSGAGSLSASLTQGMAVTATYAGVGLLSAEILIPGHVNNWVVEATFNGAGALTASLNMGMLVAGSYAGAGSLSATLRQGMVTSASFQGAGLLSASIVQQLQLLAAFVGSGNLTADLAKSKTVAATFQGAGSLSATINLQLPLIAAFAGAGALSASLSQNMVVRGTFIGAGALTANILPQKLLSATFAGSGALSAALTQGMAINATFGGVGTLNAIILIPGVANNWTIQASFTGAGILSAALRQSMAVSGTFGGVGLVTGSLSMRQSVSAAFGGAGLLASSLTMRLGVRANLIGLGSMVSDIFIRTAVNHLISAAFVGRGSLSANLVVTRVASSELPPGYESQVGVWHTQGRGGQRTGKRYRIYNTSGSS